MIALARHVGRHRGLDDIDRDRAPVVDQRDVLLFLLAVFALVTVRQDTLLDTVFAGAGGGLVSSSPAGLSCVISCTVPFASGTAITLTAAYSTRPRRCPR